MKPEQMLQQATHIFVGVIEKQEFEDWRIAWLYRYSWLGQKFPWFFPSDRYQPLRRRVRVEMVLRGTEPRSIIDIYEVYWTGATTGDWNFTHDNERDLFLVRLENGRYHVVRDWWRSIFPIMSGRHTRLPLDDSRPFWERIALMNWWVQPGANRGLVDNSHGDPQHALLQWRPVKILRGLLRHPDRNLQLRACEKLLNWRVAQDECWNSLTPEERKMPDRYYNGINPASAWEQNRRFEKQYALQSWNGLIREKNFSPNAVERIWAIDEMRLYTTINNRRVREEFCQLFLKEFPDDKDNGCPAGQPLPATIVTEDGDVPLLGQWPKGDK